MSARLPFTTATRGISTRTPFRTRKPKLGAEPRSTLPNQTDANGIPEIAKTAGGNQKYNNNLSWLPGQRLSCVSSSFFPSLFSN